MKFIPKPKHLGREYGSQFEDQSVAAAYLHRPPYPSELFDILESLIGEGPHVVLDIGCGTGEVAVPLAGRVDRVDAVDPSEAMLKMVQTRQGWGRDNIRWVCTSAEAFDYQERYRLTVSGASFHWMDWYVVLPRMRRSLRDNAFLAICGGRQESAATMPWWEKLREIIPRYSTNQDFEPYDLFEELGRRSLFQVTGRRETSPAYFRIRVEDYVEMVHSQYGFSSERMTKESAAAFASEVTEAVSPYASGEELLLQFTSTVTWGRPLVG